MLLRTPHVRQAVKLVIDAALAALAWVVASALMGGDPPHSSGALVWTAVALGVNLLFGYTRIHYRTLGQQDSLRILAGTLVLLVGVLGIHPLEPMLGIPHVPLSIATAASLLTGSMWVVIRVGIMVVYERQADGPGRSDHPKGSALRTLIVGAGRAGLLVAQELRRHPELGCTVVGFSDDALEKQGVRIQGIPVLGHTQVIPAIIHEHQIEQVVLAIPSASGPVIRSMTEAVQKTGVRLRTVPGIFNLLGNQSWKPELRDVSIEDLLRREPVKLDLSSLQQALQDAVVLITGAGGSIGSELVRQVCVFRPAKVVLLGRGENSLWEIQREIRRAFPDQVLELELCDIRNTTRLNNAFQTWRPQIVLHAAAHKHVPFLELYPEEGIENNSIGTGNVVSAAVAHGTRIFVNISTDKAVNPTNVLGATKRIAELLVCQAARRAGDHTKFVSVRFGNVLGSRGSVIPLFKEQIREGGPITVTHPEMTRYFMTIPEAAQLVLQAGVLGDTGKVYLLDMGEPVRIVDLAKDMARLSGFTPGVDIEIKFTGIRPGEKLYEELFTDQEDRETHVHPKVFESGQEPMDEELLRRGLDSLQRAVHLPSGTRQREFLRWLQELVPTYQPSPVGLGIYATLDAPIPKDVATSVQ
ncbi:MAG TPA: nucleoside-diphosphate sugar epimerase/dehydratase [Holophagaceae bacterium]|nr:nucleoside-diphosphate sugar epimerase/dehydratase [Holophagaceae bacterium]